MTNLPDYGDLEAYFAGYGEPWEVWEGSISKKIQRSQYTKWLVELAEWKSFVTLTFREDRTFDVAKRMFDKLVRELNKDLLGKHYVRYAGRSYFSFVVAAEFQLRGVIHFHFIADQPLHFALIHSLWYQWAGFAHTASIRKVESAVRYTVKYLVKGMKFEVHRTTWKGNLHVVPSWWNRVESEEADNGHGLLQGTGGLGDQ
jgi:hypothetical protein